MKKLKSIVRILAIAVLFLMYSPSFAQGPPPPPGGPAGGDENTQGGGAPIGGGMGILLALGISYGAKKVYDLRNLKRETLEE